MSLSWRVDVGGSELAGSGLSATISWGRDDPDSQPPSSTASVTFTDPAGTIAAGVEIADTLDVVAVLAGVEHRRYSGTVVDVVTDHAAQRTTVTAAGELSRLARYRIGDTPWPAELDGERVARILAAAGVLVEIETVWADATGPWADAEGTWRELRKPTIDLGTVTLRGRDVDSQPATKLLQDSASSAGGVVYETRDGVIAYRDRRARTRAVDIDAHASELLAAATFSRTTEGITNTVEIEYGDEPGDGGGRPTLTVEHEPSVATFGRFDRRWSTELADVDDAETLARELVNRRAVPQWGIDVLTYDTKVGDDAATAALMAANVGDTLRVTGVAAPTPAADLLVIVEGARETIDPGSWLVELRCSDARLSVFPESWTFHADNDPGRRWADVPAGVPWFRADDLLPIT